MECQVVEEDIELIMSTHVSNVGTSMEKRPIHASAQIEIASGVLRGDANFHNKKLIAFMTLISMVHGLEKFEVKRLVLDPTLQGLVGRVTLANGCSH